MKDLSLEQLRSLENAMNVLEKLGIHSIPMFCEPINAIINEIHKKEFAEDIQEGIKATEERTRWLNKVMGRWPS